MIKHFKFSKGLHWITFCCFFLPFFYTGCGPSYKEKEAAEKAKQDSAATITSNSVKEPKDSLTAKSFDITYNKQIASLSADTISKTETKTPSQKIVNEFKILRPVLIPKEDTYTGIATVIDSIPFIAYFAIFISFLFLIISLIIKFIEKNARKTIVLLDVLTIIFLFISTPYSWNSEKLWGFWVATTFTIVLTIYDFYIIRHIKKHKRVLKLD